MTVVVIAALALVALVALGEWAIAAADNRKLRRLVAQRRLEAGVFDGRPHPGQPGAAASGAPEGAACPWPRLEPEVELLRKRAVL